VSRSVAVEVEQALGPGVDFERSRNRDLVGVRARASAGWLGFDRAALAGSDDGHGRSVPVLVALPTSTFAGARLEVEVVGGWRLRTGVILVARVPGGPEPIPELSRAAAGVRDGGTWFDAEAADFEVRRARQRHRERASHERILGGRAWQANGKRRPELARFGTPHSIAEYNLRRLPARFLRALEGLLDDDERMLYWIERPMATDVGLMRRLRGFDRRAAVLALTDRPLLWIVDHAQPDRYLSDWGADVELLPVERILATTCRLRGNVIEFAVSTLAGARIYLLPPELGEEVRAMGDLIARFTPAGAGSLPRRMYPVEPIAFDVQAAARFGQEAEALRLFESAAGRGDVVAFLFSPRRSGQRSPTALILRSTEIELDGGRVDVGMRFTDIGAIRVTLSPLIGRIAAGSDLEFTYPAPLADRAAAFVRLARRALANVS
jgi:hypothetical protein